MAGIAGHAASARIAANTILEMGEWSLDLERGMEEDTEFGDTWESQISTVGKWSASIKGRWGADGTQQAAIQTAILGGTSVALRLYVNSTNYYSGTAYPMKFSPSANTKGLVEMDISFTGTGALSYT